MIAVELSLKQLMDAVKQLSPSEKLQLNELMWSEDSAIPVQHQQLVKERIKKAKANPESLLDWEDAIKSLNA
jgi:hypothetical protein